MNMKMWCFVWMEVAWWCTVAAGDCNVIVNHRSYRKEVLVSSVLWTFGLAVDFRNNTLYLSFVGGFKQSAKVDLHSKALTVIEELNGWCIFTVDQARGYVYAGCHKDGGAPGGLYQWDSNTGRFELVGEAEQAVAFAHYNSGKLYYSYYNEYLLRAFSDGHSVLQTAPKSPVQSLVVDTRGDKIFTNDTGVYRWRRWDGAKITRYGEFKTAVQALAVDSRGTAYACKAGFPRGVWSLDYDGTATKVLDVQCYALTFDAEDNIIYQDEDSFDVVRLLPCWRLRHLDQ